MPNSEKRVVASDLLETIRLFSMGIRFSAEADIGVAALCGGNASVGCR